MSPYHTSLIKPGFVCEWSGVWVRYSSRRSCLRPSSQHVCPINGLYVIFPPCLTYTTLPNISPHSLRGHHHRHTLRLSITSTGMVLSSSVPVPHFYPPTSHSRTTMDLYAEKVSLHFTLFIPRPTSIHNCMYEAEHPFVVDSNLTTNSSLNEGHSFEHQLHSLTKLELLSLNNEIEFNSRNEAYFCNKIKCLIHGSLN